MLFDRFRKPKWQHSNPEVRKRAVAQLSARDPEQLRVLVELASADAAPEVRRSAVKCLSDLDFLRQRASADGDPAVREAAAVRYRQLLAGGVEGMDLSARLAELARCAEPLSLAHVARSAREPELRMAALGRAVAPAVIEDAALNDGDRRVREFALQRLDDPEALQRLEAALRESDRRLAKLVRERRQLLLAAAERARQAAIAYQEVLAELEAHAVAPLEPGYEAAIQRLTNRWEQVAGEPGELLRRFDELCQQCRRRAAAQPPADAEPAVAASAAVQCCLELEAELGRLRVAAEPDAAGLPALQRRRDELHERWRTAPEAEQAERFDAALGIIDDYLRKAERYLVERPALEAELDALAAPEQLPPASLRSALRQLAGRLKPLRWHASLPVGELVRRGERVLAAAEAALAAAATREAELAARCRQCLEGVEQALDQGELREARALMKQAQELVEALPAANRGKPEQRLRALRGRIEQLLDWRRFATLPKQEELCERMEALLDVELEAPERARQVKALQEEWQATGGSDSAEGRRLWERFRAAGQQAFEPCKAYFDEQEQLRRVNLERRHELCAQLEVFVAEADWDALDGDFAVRVRQQARQEWQTAAPVDRRAGRAVQQRFDGLMERLSAHIDACRERRCSRRAALLEAAEAAVELPELPAAIARVKALQEDWRLLGRVATALERRQADAFRRACNAVFERRDEQRERGERRREENLTQARALAVEARELLTLGDAELGWGIARLRELEAALDGLRPLPVAEQEALRSELAAVAGALHARRRALAQREAEREQRALEHSVQLCGRLERLVQQRPADLERLRAALEREWGERPALADRLERVTRERWEAALGRLDSGEAFVNELLEGNAEQRRRLCVRLEILAGLESPPEDAQLRLDLQVERLAQGMAGRTRENPRNEAQALEFEWYGLGPGGEERYAERVRAALAALRSVAA